MGCEWASFPGIDLPQRFHWKAGVGTWKLSPWWQDKAWIRHTRGTYILAPYSALFPSPLPFLTLPGVRAPWSSCIPTDAWPSACSPALLPVPSSSESTENQAEKQQTQPLLLTPDPFHCSHGEGERPTCVALWDGPKSACPPVCLKANGVFVKDFCQNNLW